MLHTTRNSRILLLATLDPRDEVRRAVAYSFSGLSLIHISEPTRLGMISYAVYCGNTGLSITFTGPCGRSQASKSAQNGIDSTILCHGR